MSHKIIIADDHMIVRIGTSEVLKSTLPDIEIDFAERYEQLKANLHNKNYDLILLDIDMPGTKHTEMILELKNIQPEIKILIFSGYGPETAIQYIYAGADGYLSKQSNESGIKYAVQSMLETGSYYPKEIIPLLKRDNSPVNLVNKLSRREYEVFELLAKGNGNLEISNALGLEITTISTFKRRLFKKLKINNIIELGKIYQNIH